MPTLPSGRRIEFSLDRFHGLLQRVEPREARALAAQLDEPDDLLFVLEAVHFGIADGAPYFAGYLASDWKTRAADWSTADRQAMADWLVSKTARESRAEAIDYIKALFEDGPGSRVAYPYVIAGEICHPAALPAPSSRQ